MSRIHRPGARAIRFAAPLLCTLALALAACRQQPPQPPAPTEVAVGVQTLTTRSLEVQQSLAGRTVAHMVSEVRPQVGGIIQKRLFTEGQQVQAGQVLYQLDPRSYQAALDSAKGDLAKAEAAVASARPKAQRYRDMAAIDAVSQQDLDDADAALREAQASVVAAQAAVRTAQINLDYTRITAPISGRIGTSTYTPGALVTQNQETALATIQQLDPVYVDVTLSSAQLLGLRKQIDSGALQAVNGKSQVSLVLEDGAAYAHPGTLEFVGTSVSTGTGSVVLRAVVPNPEGLLLPGAYVRAVLPLAVNAQAILVPQSAVTRNTQGEALVKLVDDAGQVQQRTVQTGEAVQDQWVITGGLSAGEKLIVDGASKAEPGQVVKVEPAPAGEGVQSASVKPAEAGAPGAQ